MKQISLLIADDHAILRQGLCALLNSGGRFTIVGEASNGREAIAMAEALKPDLILMDIAMPILNGMEATRQILEANPTAKIVILSAHTEDEYIERMNAAGVVGFLEKQLSAEILTGALVQVAAGNKFFGPSVAKQLRNNSNRPLGRDGRPKTNGTQLTSRESEILQLVAEGATNKRSASELGISIKTVEKHRQHLMDKLNIHDTAGLTRYAISIGVIESSVRLTLT
jgi:DNA-binding NarL/FixJ family response regulator